MSALIRNKNLLSGALILFLGLFFAFAGRGLTFGTPSRMGAGFVPFLLCGGLVAIGAVLIGKSWRDAKPTGEWPGARALVVIAAAPLLFGALIRPAGLVITILAVSLLSRAAMPGRPGWVDLATAAALSAFCSLVFVVLLEQSLPLWP